MQLINRVWCVIFAITLLTGCGIFSTYEEPPVTSPRAKVTFAISTYFNDYNYGIFSAIIRETNNSWTTLRHPSSVIFTKLINRKFDIPTPEGSKILYNVYIPANEPFKFKATVSHYWYSEVRYPDSQADRKSVCLYDKIEFKPEENGEYLVFIDNLERNLNYKQKCSLTIKQLVRRNGDIQWKDVEFDSKITGDGMQTSIIFPDD